jgi:hypothetical protein
LRISRQLWGASEEREQLRDLVRCCEDLRVDLMRARHRLATVLVASRALLPGPGGRWTLKHRHWLSPQHFGDHASRITYADDLHAWRVQRRLNARWDLLRNGRSKPAGVVTIAIARELVGACWEIATAPEIPLTSVWRVWRVEAARRSGHAHARTSAISPVSPATPGGRAHPI